MSATEKIPANFELGRSEDIEWLIQEANKKR